MAFTNQEKAQFRTHAQEVTRIDFVALPQPERDRLEVEYKAEWDEINDTTSIEANKLKLAIYANLLDPNDNADRINESDWILNNITQAQILINTIQPNALHYWVDANGVKNNDGRGTLRTGEDGIYGEMTQRCVLALFGLNVPVPVRTTPAVVPSVTGAVTTSLRPEARPTASEIIIASGNDAFTPEQMVNMRRTILSDSHLKGELEKIGVRFVRNDETGALDMILPKGFETTPEYRQLQTYIRALHMTTDPEYTNPLTLTDEMRKEKMEMYFEIIRGSGDHIMGREFLAYKLINSINEDLKMDPRGPYIMTRSGEQGEYGIFEFPITRDASNYKISSALAPATLPYHEILAAGNIKDDYIDFATTYALVEGNHIAFQGKEFLGQATLVNRILEKHGITGVSEEDVQDGNLLIADWDIVKDQIDSKIEALSEGNAQNVEAYQELMYVKDLIEGKEWMAEGRTQDMFREINTFGRLFLEEKSLIDDALNRLNGSGTDETTGEMIRNIAAENLFGLPGLLALFIAIFNIGGLGKAAGIGLLGAAGAMAGGSIIDSITDRTGDPLSGTNGGENLELVRIRQLQYGIKGDDALNTTLTNLYKENDNRNERSRSTANRELFVEEPLVLGKILFEVSESNDLSTLDLSDNDLANKIFNQMSTDGALSVDGTEFTSNVSRNPTVTQADVNAFVEILRSQADGVDTTLGDILVAGDIDRLNHEYDTSWFDYTENSYISGQIHDAYRTAWNAGDRDQRKELLAVIEATDANLYSGTTADTASDAWSAAPGVLGGLRNVFADTTGVGVQQRLDKIDDLIATISTSSIEPGVQSQVLQLLRKNKDFLESEDSFNTMRSTWYDDAGNTLTRVDLTGWLGFTGLPNTSATEQEIAYTAVRTDIAGKLGTLTGLLGSMSGAEYAELSTEVQKEIDHLNAMDALAEQKIIDLADFADVSSGTGLDISQDVNLAKVTTIAQGIQDELRESIELRAGNLFWNQSGVNIAAEIVKVYDDAKATAGTAGDISQMAGIDLWNNIHGGIVSSLGLVPKYGTVVSSAVTAYLPSPINPITGQANTLDARTIQDIEAQIKLALIKKYLEEQQENIQNYQQLEDLYTSTGKLPAGVPLATPSGTVMTYPTDTPEQARLRAILTTEHEAFLSDIRDQVEDFASSYDGANQVGVINSLTNTIDLTTVEEYQNVATFLHNSGNLDTVIPIIRKLVADTFVDNPNFLDATLITVAELKGGNTTIGFDGFDRKLADYINAIETDTITDETTIPTSTATFVDIEKNITLLKAVQGLTGGPGNSTDIDRALGLWEVRKLEVATVNQIPEMRSAIDADISQIDTDIAQLNTDLNALKLISTPSAATTTEINTKELEIEEKTQLRVILKDAIDATPFTISTLKLALGNSYSDPTRARIDFTESFYQNSKNIFDTL